MKSEADSIRQGRLPQEQCIEPAVNGVWKHGARKHNDERSLQSTSAYAHDLPPSTDTTGRQNTWRQRGKPTWMDGYEYAQRQLYRAKSMWHISSISTDGHMGTSTHIHCCGSTAEAFPGCCHRDRALCEEKHPSNREAGKCESALRSTKSLD